MLHHSLRREGFSYRITIRSLIWVIYLAILVGLSIWWFST